MDSIRQKIHIWEYSICCLGLIYLIWAGVLIYKASFVAIDSNRYFYLFDDAMISMRYAWNFAHGDGLVWNIGEYIEGYTNLLQVLIMAIPSSFLNKRLSVLSIQILGAIWPVLIAYLSIKLYREIPAWKDQGRVPESLIFLSVLLTYPMSFLSIMGMETGLLTTLLLVGVLWIFQFWVDSNNRRLQLAAFFLSLAYLARPDSLPISALIILYSLFSSQLSTGIRPLHKWDFFLWLKVIGLLLLFPIAQQVFRAIYYSEIVPNTYLLKLGNFKLLDRIQNGYAYSSPFFQEYAPMLILAFLAVFSIRKREVRVLGFIVFSFICYQVYVGGDAWRLWRFASPAIPILIILSIGHLWQILIIERKERVQNIGDSVGWNLKIVKIPWLKAYLNKATTSYFAYILLIFLSLTTINVFRKSHSFLLFGIITVLSLPATFLSKFLKVDMRKVTAPRIGALLAILILIITSANARFSDEMLFQVPPYQSESNVTHVNTALAIQEVTDETATLAVIWAGTLPYYADRYTYDMLGKMDPVIARMTPKMHGMFRKGSMITWPGHNKFDLYYSIENNEPTYVQQFIWGDDNLYSWGLDHYEQVLYKGIGLNLLNESENVSWRLLD